MSAIGHCQRQSTALYALWSDLIGHLLGSQVFVKEKKHNIARKLGSLNRQVNHIHLFSITGISREPVYLK